ncbi:amidase [Nocardia concava]|uniref:amidase n=1 Tax=Nocardia concava TaxID=257281 RepID=UPI0003163305|nr:amidase [Nocardia concava]
MSTSKLAETTGGSSPELAFEGVAGMAEKVAGRAISARELTAYCLDRIDRLDPRLGAFVAVLREEALAEAAALDERQARGEELGPLHGVPIAIKDENHVRGVVTGYGTGAFDRVAEADSAVVARLREAGAVIIGKTAMPEFGIYPFTESITHGHTRNPWDPEKSTAGSSGGTAAAVASGMVPAGIGGDGGGSIRLPSAWCGLFGLKPQRGRVSTAPNSDLWKSLGTLGPLTRSVRDSALIYDAISGTTPGVDRFTAEPWPITLSEAAVREPGRLRIALSLAPPAFTTSVDAATASAVRRMADLLADLGHEVIEQDPDYVELAAAFSPQMAAGVAEEAARADHRERLDRRTLTLAALGRPANNRVIEPAAEALAARLSAKILGIFDTVDVVLCPTVPSTAWPLGQLDDVGFVKASARGLRAAGYTIVWNVCGNPAAAVPAGFDVTGMPYSVQLVGRPHDEPTLVSLAAQIEAAQPWAHARPRLS